uniref:(northern house mosquito) hypothetical protein n=1 Tax=Culex pipiens TaxID=7175 RepID=A0A8D8FS25_CULPI
MCHEGVSERFQPGASGEKHTSSSRILLYRRFSTVQFAVSDVAEISRDDTIVWCNSVHVDKPQRIVGIVSIVSNAVRREPGRPCVCHTAIPKAINHRSRAGLYRG